MMSGVIFGFCVHVLCLQLIIVDAFSLRSRNVSESDGNVIRCYCNLPSCITTNYMCKSETNENGCFKKFDVATQQIHCGCLEQSIKWQCSDVTDVSSTTSSLDEEHPFHCCYSDLCNSEVSEKQLNTIQSTSIHINESDEEKLNEIILSAKNVNYRISSSSYVTSDTWFRAIMIAVPVLGLIILLKLADVACRLLKSDTSEERRNAAKLVTQNCDFPVKNNSKLSLASIPETHSYRSYLLPKCNLFDRKFLFVFRQQDKSQSAKNAKYVYVSTEQESINNSVPRIPEKFSKQNLNILKLPYKFNELKDKSSKNVKVGVNNSNNCYSIINPVTLNSNSLDIKRI